MSLSTVLNFNGGGFGIDFKLAKSMFFDRDAISNALSKQDKEILGRFGGRLRLVARSSMRRRKKPSPPGTPPSAHEDEQHKRGPLLKKKLFYFYDPTTKSVVVGPMKLGKSNASALQEFGGSTTRKFKIPPPPKKQLTEAQKAAFIAGVKSGKIVPVKRKTQYVTKTVSLPERPYMRPAMQKELAKFPTLYAGKITG